MKLETAQALVRSLVGRLKLQEGFWRLPKARLSDDEVSALKLLSGSTTQAADAGTTNVDYLKTSPDETVEPPAAAIEIDRNALKNDGPPENEIRLCIDFGTAMSKACVTGVADDDVIPLQLGREVGEGDVWSVPSSLYVSDSGKIYFGHAAERQHTADVSNDYNRGRFDNIKYMLSESAPNSNLYDIPLPVYIDPSNRMTYGDALLLYLAWLTDHACKAMKRTEPARFSRYIKRRFAIPCFESASDEQMHGEERAKWARSVISEAMAYAQIVADTFTNEWSELTVETALPVVRMCTGTIVSHDLGHLFTQSPDIREPIAAGASQFSEQVEQAVERQPRRVLLVVDAGAGTTDFALFNVATKQNQDVKYSLDPSSVRMCRDAGNRVDAILRGIIIRKCGVNEGSLGPQGYQTAKNDLDRRIRDIKQQLFDDGSAAFNIRPGIDGELDRSEVEQHEDYLELGHRLLRIRNEIIAGAVLRENPHPGAHDTLAVDVLLTGGSSILPVFRNLATGEVVQKGWNIRFQAVGSEWIDHLAARHGEDFVEQYPQLAVAIGGAAPRCPEELSTWEGIILPSPPGSRSISTIYRGQ